MKAWEAEYKARHSAVPVDFEQNPSDWSGIGKILEYRRGMLSMLWKSEVPGSRAPESMFTEMVQAWSNRGYDVSEAESLLEAAWQAHAEGDYGSLERITGQIQLALRNAPKDPSSDYWEYAQPEKWEDIRSLFPVTCRRESVRVEGIGKHFSDEELEKRILGGWIGQIVGGAYGTALEGYTGETLRQTYGDRLNGYVREPETYNDDITYELAFLSTADEKGRQLTSGDIADKWLQLIPFGWSAEYFALENLRRGIYPPESGRFGNFFSEWIGAQMRTMVCGLVAPGRPMEAARLAYLDSIVSHEKNGVYGGIHSAVLTSLAFLISDSRELLAASRDYVPDGTQFAALFDEVLDTVQKHDDHIASWEKVAKRLERYNWIHTYPNMAAVLHSLWYCENSFDRALRILADCGMDVDCNAGEVGCALGVMNPSGIDTKWTDPIGDELQTYVPGFERMKVTELVRWTLEIGRKLAGDS